MSTRRRACGWAVVLGALALGRPAAAYECARVSNINQVASGPSLHWGSRKISFSIHNDGSGFTKTLGDDDVEKTVEKAFRRWTSPLQLVGDIDPSSCTLVPPSTLIDTDIVFDYQGGFNQSFAGYNYLRDEAYNRNMVIFRDDFWPYESTTHARAIALTVDSVDTVTGRIFDSDIEINTHGFKFFAGDGTPAEDETDLLNTLVHEVGHVLGLGHSTDANAVMYRQADPQEVKKRYLSCDDATLLAFRYPPGGETGFCSTKNSKATCGDCQEGEALANAANVVIRQHDDGMRAHGCQGPGGGALLSAAWTVGYAAAGRRRRRERGAGPPRHSSERRG